jgi:hypothetical protein
MVNGRWRLSAGIALKYHLAVLTEDLMAAFPLPRIVKGAAWRDKHRLKCKTMDLIFEGERTAAGRRRQASPVAARQEEKDPGSRNFTFRLPEQNAMVVQAHSSLFERETSYFHRDGVGRLDDEHWPKVHFIADRVA